MKKLGYKHVGVIIMAVCFVAAVGLLGVQYYEKHYLAPPHSEAELQPEVTAEGLLALVSRLAGQMTQSVRKSRLLAVHIAVPGLVDMESGAVSWDLRQRRFWPAEVQVQIQCCSPECFRYHWTLKK